MRLPLQANGGERRRLSYFPVAKILVGAERHETETANEVWHGHLQTHSMHAPRSCYFKMLEPREFWIEATCLAFSSAAGLQVGDCYLGDLMRETLPSSHRWHPGEARRMVMAVATIRGATAHALGETHVMKKLRKDPKFPLMCAIDELFANADRHSDNVMVDGKGCPYLIDFGQAFGGCDHPLQHCWPSFSNQLLDEAVALMDLRQRQDFGIDLSTAVNELKEALPVLTEVLATCPERQAIINFVHTRMNVLPDLLSIRLEAGQEQLSFRLTTQAEYRR